MAVVHTSSCSRSSKSIKFAVVLSSGQTGGTFTDVWASALDERNVVNQSRCPSPCHYSDAPADGIRRVLEAISGSEIPRRSPIPEGADPLH
ncbi:hypothetical protein PG994_003159 [Apiospora phragmitis]|uniref:Uncharacterized protein n=1 Tax=Apiospora phragmitis TaxID=2905665 RepID=A0ABR1W799_9PEZI